MSILASLVPNNLIGFSVSRYIWQTTQLLIGSIINTNLPLMERTDLLLASICWASFLLGMIPIRLQWMSEEYAFLDSISVYLLSLFLLWSLWPPQNLRLACCLWPLQVVCSAARCLFCIGTLCRTYLANFWSRCFASAFSHAVGFAGLWMCSNNDFSIGARTSLAGPAMGGPFSAEVRHSLCSTFVWSHSQTEFLYGMQGTYVSVHV